MSRSRDKRAVNTSGDAEMAPQKKRVAKELKALLEDEAEAVCDVGHRERELSGPQEHPEGNNPVTDYHGGERPIPETQHRELGNELQEIRRKVAGYMSKTFHAKREQFLRNNNVALEGIQQKYVKAREKWEEKREEFFLEYSQQLQSLFQERDRDVQKLKEEEENLAILIKKKQKLCQQARTVESQSQKKYRTVGDEILKNMKSFMEEHVRGDAIEREEFQQDIVKLQNKIMDDTQLKEMADIQEILQSLPVHDSEERT